MILEVYLCGICIHAVNSLFHIESLRIRKKLTRDRPGRATVSRELEYYTKNIPWSLLWPIDLVRRALELCKTEF